MNVSYGVHRLILTGLFTPLAAVLLAHAARASASVPSLFDRHSSAVGELERWYGDVADDCGDTESPAYRCTGILLRATRTVPGLLPWESSEAQRAKGSISFSWVRQDVGFGKPFERQNGFILYPNEQVPEGQLADLQILCSFPINAGTFGRPTLQGCGPVMSHPQDTDTCQRLGIVTVRQWLERYPHPDTGRVCGWDLRDPRGRGPAWAFNLAAASHQGLPDPFWATNNEVLVSAWAEASGGQLPLHSFFHVPGEREALVKAQHDQIRYFQLHGRVPPIVQLRFPASRHEPMSFAYDRRDQAWGQPVRTGVVDFEALAPGPRKHVASAGFEFRLARDRAEVSDRPHPGSHGLIASRHLSADSTIRFTVEGAGRRRLSFSWGCNRYCALQTVVTDKHTLLLDEEDGTMHYGVIERVVDGPEAFMLITDSEENDAELVLDTLSISVLPEQ